MGIVPTKSDTTTPYSLSEARRCPLKLGNHDTNGSWVEVEDTGGLQPIQSDAALKVKTDENGDPCEHKVRVVSGGHMQVEGVNYDAIQALVVRWSSLCLLLSIAA